MERFPDRVERLSSRVGEVSDVYGLACDEQSVEGEKKALLFLA
jgi:hypothetical protein